MTQNTHYTRQGSRKNAKNSGPRTNQQIRVPEVLLIDQNGEKVGIKSIEEALAIAGAVNLDLVEISPQGVPPVCRVMDYGRFRYQEQKKKHEAKKKQKIVELKEVKFGLRTEEHDYQFKLRNAQKFLEQGNKVKFSVRFRGREIANQQLGRELFSKVAQDCAEFGVLDGSMKMEGRQMVMILAPKKAVSTK